MQKGSLESLKPRANNWGAAPVHARAFAWLDQTAHAPRSWCSPPRNQSDQQQPQKANPRYYACSKKKKRVSWNRRKVIYDNFPRLESFLQRTNQPATALRVGTRRQPQRYRSRLRQGWVGQPLRRVRRSKCVEGMNEFVRRLRCAAQPAVTPHTLR